MSPTASAGGVPVSPRPDRVLTSTGGTVVARCVDGGAYLVSWSPAQGYRAEEVRRGRAAVARVSFAASRKIVLYVRCVAGVPQLHVGGGDDDAECEGP